MITFTVDNEKLICYFSEQMDTESCLKYQEEIYGKVRESKKPVIFDMQKVGYIASVFLAMCIQISKEVGSGNFTLRNVHPNVKKVFKIAKMDKLMNII
ncbi:MAG: STAS domain-containing protein [Candidatus Omnitrophota bacterium]